MVFVLHFLGCVDVLGLQVLASKHAQVCLSGELLGPRHAFRVFQLAHGTFVCACLSCVQVCFGCVCLLFVVFCFWVCSVFVALCVVLSFVSLTWV